MTNSNVIAIIGGTGFVGQEVIRQLKNLGLRAVNVDCKAPLRSETEYRRADLCDTPSLVAALEGCSSAIFLAAEWRDDVTPVSRYYDVNVKGASNFADAARAVGLKRCIFTSSVSVYGPTQYEVGEDYPPAPINDYGKSKLQAEEALRKWAESDPEISLAIVRPTVIFGPGNRGNVWNLLSQMANGPFVMIGSGTNQKSMAYVENVSAFLIHQLSAQSGVSVYNYADKPDFDMNALVKLIDHQLMRPKRSSLRVPQTLAMALGQAFDLLGRLLGRKFGITKERVFKFCANTQYSADSALKTGFVPPVSLSDALSITVDAEFGGQVQR